MIYMETSYGEIPWAAASMELHYGDEEYKVEANEDGEPPNPQQSLTNLGGIGRSNASPLTLTLELSKTRRTTSRCLFSSKGRRL